MTVYFKNTTLNIYRLTAGGTGLYGEPVEEYTPAGAVFVDFQNENNNEIRKDYGIEKQNLYKMTVLQQIKSQPNTSY